MVLPQNVNANPINGTYSHNPTSNGHGHSDVGVVVGNSSSIDETGGDGAVSGAAISSDPVTSNLINSSNHSETPLTLSKGSCLVTTKFPENSKERKAGI